MDRDETDEHLIAALSEGLPLVSQPYLALAQKFSLSEDEVIARIKALADAEKLSRFGVVVRHRKLGYQANAMVVWDICDDDVSRLAKILAAEPCVTLCYRRPRREGWPYNLFTMIHGTSRDETLGNLERLVQAHGLAGISRDALFSTRCFKQNGARYGVKPKPVEVAVS